MTPQTAVLLLGASGRLGTRLHARLCEHNARVLAVTRTRPASPTLHTGDVIHLDLTNSDHRAQAQRRLADLLTPYERVVVIDSVLDRSTVTAMRRSITAATTFTATLCAELAAADTRCHVMAASTTAVLAPTAVQTPYGLAKLRQLRRYTAHDFDVTAFLLPSLTHQHETAPKPTTTWTFDHAAILMTSALNTQQTPKSLLVPPPHSGPPHTPPPPSGAIGPKQAFTAHVEAFLTRRDCPHAHRTASHARLDLLPAAIRTRVDHHLRPPNRIQRLSRTLGVPVMFLHPA